MAQRILIIEKTWLQKWNFKIKFQYDSIPSNSIFKRVGMVTACLHFKARHILQSASCRLHQSFCHFSPVNLLILVLKRAEWFVAYGTLEWQDALKNVKVKHIKVGPARSVQRKDLPFHWHAHCANFNGFALWLEWNADEKLLKSTVQIFISDIQKWRRESTTRSLQTYLTRVYRIWRLHSC